MKDLSVYQRLALNIFGDVKLPSKSHLIPSKFHHVNNCCYVMKCKIHGLVVTYPSGFGQSLLCPECLSDVNDN